MPGFMPEAFVAAALGIAMLFGLLFSPRRRRARQPLPDQWRERTYVTVPQTRYLQPAQRAQYEACVERFLREKRHVGCDGLVVDDEMRIAVAGLACLLLLRAPAAREVFPELRSVLIYPERFLVPQAEPDEWGLVDDDAADVGVEHLGESWQGERVILSWADVRDALDGMPHNVVVHEFAHQLDDETPATEGAPQLADYTRWTAVMQREYERLQRHRRPPVLDPYGAQSPGEFFGVVTEAFFQRGALLKRHHGELYALLADYYRLDTAAVDLWPDLGHMERIT